MLRGILHNVQAGGEEFVTFVSLELSVTQTHPACVPSPASPLSKARQSPRIRSVLSMAAKSSGPTGTSRDVSACSSASDKVNLVRNRWTRDCWVVVVVLAKFQRGASVVYSSVERTHRLSPLLPQSFSVFEQVASAGIGLL